MSDPVWKSKDLGVVSAFGVAKANGWTGTEAEWEALQANAPAMGLKAEGYAVGKQNGTDVAEGQTYYHDNTKWYKEQAAGSAASAAASAADAAQYTHDAVSDWLNDKFGQITADPPLDRTLSQALAAAPADMVGDLNSAINNTVEALSEQTEYAVVQDSNAYTEHGLTFSGNNKLLSIYGTAQSGVRYYDGLNGNSVLQVGSATPSKVLEPGKYRIKLKIVSGQLVLPTTEPLLVYITTGTAGNPELRLKDGDIFTIASSSAVLLKILGTTQFGTSENPTVIDYAIDSITAKDDTARNDIAKAAKKIPRIPYAYVKDSELAAHGLTITGKNGLLYIYGTAESGIKYYEGLNGTCDLMGQSKVPTKILPPGTYIARMKIISGTYSAPQPLYFRVTTTDAGTADLDLQDGDIFTITQDAAIVIRIIGTSQFGTQANPTVIDFGVDLVTVSKYDIVPTGDDTDRTSEIKMVLAAKDVCLFAPGEYYFDTFEIGQGKRLVGSGKTQTKLIYKAVSTPASWYAIRMRAYSSLTNLSLETYQESGNDITPVEDYTLGVHGIRIGDNDNGETKTDDIGITIEDVLIKNFSGCGIFNRHVSQDVVGSTFINVEVKRCSAGIYLSEYAEFNIVTSCYFNECYTGIVLMGGNNTISGCLVGQNEIGLNLAESDSYKSSTANDAHGIIQGCKITHCGFYSGGDQYGYSILGGSQTSGEIIDGCMLSGNIKIKDRGWGLMFCGCTIRNVLSNTPPIIEIDNSKVNIFSTMFQSYNTPVSVSNGGILRRRNCLSYSGAELNDVS